MTRADGTRADGTRRKSSARILQWVISITCNGAGNIGPLKGLLGKQRSRRGTSRYTILAYDQVKVVVNPKAWMEQFYHSALVRSRELKRTNSG